MKSTQIVSEATRKRLQYEKELQLTAAKRLYNSLENIDTIYLLFPPIRPYRKTLYIRLFIVENNKIFDITQLVGEALGERTIHIQGPCGPSIKRSPRLFGSVGGELLDQISVAICPDAASDPRRVNEVKRFKMGIL